MIKTVMMTQASKTAGIIIMGGAARRLGGVDKGAIIINGKSCFARTVDAFNGPVDTIAICAGSSELPDYTAGFDTIADWPSAPDQHGGAAMAILGALDWASQNGFEQIITAPVDTPFLPSDYAARLLSAGGETAVCHSANYDHGLHAIWSVASLETLKTAIMQQKLYKVGALHDLLGSARLQFDKAPFDRFFNLNTPQAVQAAQEIAKSFNL